MSVHGSPIPPWQALNDEQARRWRRVLDTLATLIPDGPATVVVDAYAGTPGATAVYPAAVADRLAVTLHQLGRPSARLSMDTPAADVVIDLHDPAWPVIRHIDASMAEHDSWYLAESRAFFATPRRFFAQAVRV